MPPPTRVPNASDYFPVQQAKVYGDQTFEMGLVLGGTVSAGAYTAGALDYLITALDAWHLGAPAPAQGRHDVKLRIAAGASGGSVNGAMLAIAATRDIAPVPTSPPAAGTTTGNPLWDVWVEQVTLAGLTGTSDLDGPEAVLNSLLNTDPIDKARDGLVQLATTRPLKPRPWLDDPFRLAFTLSNMRGVPFLLSADGWAGGPGSCTIEHSDMARFAIPMAANPADANVLRPDEFWLNPTLKGDSFCDWPTFAEFALGSGAFPVGLKARVLERPASHYLYNTYVDYDDQTKQPVVRFLDPAWGYMVPPTIVDPLYDFTVVDGGMFNNDPITVARTWLCGLASHNPRDPKLADRAILMIDPLASRQDDDRTQNVASDLIGLIGPLISGAIQGGRYLTADLMLMADDTVFSRFQLVPAEPSRGRVGDLAIIGGSLQAFGGFFDRQFQVHDFMLGRANMQSFLRREFVLHQSNKLFANWKDPADRQRWAVDATGQHKANIADGDYYLPIIPDVTFNGTDIDAGVPWAAVPWPTVPLDTANAGTLLKRRIQRVLAMAQEQSFPGFLGWLGDLLAGSTIAGAITNSLISQLQADLKTRNVPYSPAPSGS